MKADDFFIKKIKPKSGNLKTGIINNDYAAQLAEEYCQEQLLAFKQWYDKLSITSKVSVWSEDGSQNGLFEMSDKRIIEKFNAYQKPKNTTFDNPDGVIDVITN